MALILTFLGNFAAWLTVGVASFFARKVILITAATAATLACFISLVVTIKNIVEALLVAIPPLIAAGLAMAMPTNLALCVAAIFSMYFGTSMAILCKQYVRQWVSGSA